MVFKTFDDLPALAAAFGGLVFRDIADDTLYVQDTRHNAWHHYRWVPGKREIVYLERMEGALPLVTQVYPP